MLEDLRAYPWVLDPLEYSEPAALAEVVQRAARSAEVRRDELGVN
jgi:hypothetical protein